MQNIEGLETLICVVHMGKFPAFSTSIFNLTFTTNDTLW